ncbi:MAG: RimK family alpha-L-glutamate ligase, partial [Pseudomonadota bacterium]
VYYGRQVQNAAWHFRFPFVAKLPRGFGEGRGVFLIRNSEELHSYLGLTRTAYLQEYIPHSRDLRVVVVAGRVLASYWRTVPAGDFRANLFQGGQVSASDIPEEGLIFAVNVIRKCGFDDVGLDLCLHKGRWLVLEANMHYGLKGLAQTGVRLSDFLDKLIEENVI